MNRQGQISYELYIPAESANYYDMVVNYCDNSKTLELEFDKIDYKELIDKSR